MKIITKYIFINRVFLSNLLSLVFFITIETALPFYKLGAWSFWRAEQTTILPLEQIDITSIEQVDQRVRFVEDLVAQQVYPHIHHWLPHNTYFLANFDVSVQAQTSAMRVYLYQP